MRGLLEFGVNFDVSEAFETKERSRERVPLEDADEPVASRRRSLGLPGIEPIGGRPSIDSAVADGTTLLVKPKSATLSCWTILDASGSMQ